MKIFKCQCFSTEKTHLDLDMACLGCLVPVRIVVHPPGVHPAAGPVPGASHRLMAPGRRAQGRDTARWTLSRNTIISHSHPQCAVTCLLD